MFFLFSTRASIVFAFMIKYYALFVVVAIGRHHLHCNPKRRAPEVDLMIRGLVGFALVGVLVASPAMGEAGGEGVKLSGRGEFLATYLNLDDDGHV